MEPETLAKLPVAFQIVIGSGLFIGAVGSMLFGWFRKTILPELQVSETKSNDAVVLTAAVADSAAISRLAEAIKELLEYLRDDAREDHVELRRNREVLCDIRDGIERLDRHMKDRTVV